MIKILTSSAVLVVSLLHIWFLILEMFLWKKPIGLKTFGQSKEKAEMTAVLAANQGLYNGFLALGLLLSFCYSNRNTVFAFQFFFLFCVVIAGIFGALTAKRSILWIQAFPGLVALLLVYLNAKA